MTSAAAPSIARRRPRDDLIFRARLVGAAKEEVPVETLWQWNIHALDKPIVMGEPSEDFRRLVQEMIEKK